MGRKRRRKLMKKLHKWPSLIVAIFIILWAISGVILNHRYTFSSFDVDRDLLPNEHRYKNWNNASVRGSVQIDSSTIWFFGNVGVWQYDAKNAGWIDKRSGFPSGADHHKVNCLIQSSNERLFCGTRFSFYHYNSIASRWEEVIIPHHDRHVVDLAEIRDSLWVMTRSHLWKVPLEGEMTFTYAALTAPRGYDNKVGLFKTLWVIHSGEIYGIAGKLLVDFVALVFVFLTISGLIYFFFPRLMKKRKRRSMPIRKLALWNKFSIQWHNKIGIWLVIILIITTMTGMFLRPPLLIAIANDRVGKIPYSLLDDGNPWYDQLRRILYDKESGKVFLATSEGIFLMDLSLEHQPEFIYPQPPASVMGYNVFSMHHEGGILVGSFSGIYRWNPETGFIVDYLTSKPYQQPERPSGPLSQNMIAGYHLDTNGNAYVFDYNLGVIPLFHEFDFPEMPELIREAPMPLWNVALEMHTARLFKPMIGDFYILFIPLFGLSTLLILISGVVLWIRKYRRQKSK